MKPLAEMTQAEVGAFVQSHLREKGIEVVLSGGASVSIYTTGKYVTLDLDLVNVYSKSRRVIRASMEEIGFREEGRHFSHPATPHIVEFPPGPLTVGAEPVKEVQEVALSTGVLRVISPTDSVKDRLAAYYHWGDEQALEQARLVAGSNDVDIDEIRRWSVAEGKAREFDRIRRRIFPRPS
jgi:hypothetical protein